MADSLRLGLARVVTLATIVPWGSGMAGPVSTERHLRPSSPSENPAFARKYRTACSTCHTAAPKLNPLGEAFRLNGYRFPDNDELLRKDEPLPLGSEPWKDLWPRAIWPGEVSGQLPLAVGFRSDVRYTRDSDVDAAWSFRFPEEVYLIAASTLGDGISAYASTEWSPDEGLEVAQVKVGFQDIVPLLPRRAANLWVGLQSLYLLTFADEHVDGAGQQGFIWQAFSPSDLILVNPTTGEELRSSNEFELRRPQAGIEVEGIGAGRFYYAAGIAQGAGALTGDNNARKDFFYKLRYKLGGLRLDGSPEPEPDEPTGYGGQLLERSVTLEHFGYWGAEPTDSDREDTHRAFGLSARALYGRADVGVGFVWGANDAPWGSAAPGKLSHRSLFAKAEYLLYPWLIASMKFETFEATPPRETRTSGFAIGGFDRTSLRPGLIALVRQNVRAVVEAELFTEFERSALAGRTRPHSVRFRLEVAY